jgi:hypothetical protein
MKLVQSGAATKAFTENVGWITCLRARHTVQSIEQGCRGYGLALSDARRGACIKWKPALHEGGWGSLWIPV